MKDENRKIARLVKQIQRGKQSAFEEFYKLTSPKAYFIALKITQNEHDAEDILQESYIKALEKIGEIDTSQNIISWFLKIVANKSKDLLRSRNRLVFNGDEDVSFDEIPEEKTEFCPEENLNQEELRLEVMAAIDELTDEKRACIMMMYFGEMSIKEIAESIEVPESTVKNRLYTARKDLKSRFEKSGNVFYGATLGGVIIWALQKSSVTASAAFAASTASANILASIGASAVYSAVTTSSASAAVATTATASGAATAAATGTGLAAKAVALSVAQKIAVGIAATAVVGGGAAGAVTIVRHIDSKDEPTTIKEEVTTSPFTTSMDVFNEMVLTTEPTTQETRVTDTSSTLTSTKSTLTEKSTKPSTSAKPTNTKPHTTRTETTAKITTTHAPTTTQVITTTQQKTTRPVTQPTTAQPTTVLTTLAQATLIIEVTDFDDNVVDTLNLTVEAGTEMTWDYLITLVSENGYEAMAGVYGDGVGAVAQAGKTYTFTAEL